MRIRKINDDNMMTCPKCGKPGMANYKQSVYKRRNPAKGKITHQYLEVFHKVGDSWNKPTKCYIGRVDELGTDIYKALESKDIGRAYRLEKNIKNAGKEIRAYFDRYSPKTSRYMGEVTDQVLTIMERYGF